MISSLWSQKLKTVFVSILVFGCLFQTIISLYGIFISAGGTTHQHVNQGSPLESSFYDHDPTNMNVCSLPVYDYWHPKIMKYVDYDFYPTRHCNKNYKPYTKLENGVWSIVEEKKEMNCSARCFYGIDDWTVNFTAWMPPGPVNCEFLEAVCWIGKSEVYGHIHTQIIPKEPISPNNSDSPNVFVFLMDSLGTGQAKRQLPKTLSYLNSRLESVEFPFINKVGENSMPNGMALWFGKLIERVNGKNYGGMDVETDWNIEQYCRTNLNNSIFDDFKKEGYMTLSIDDWKNQMVNYPNCEGFEEAPTHHYMHPFFMIYERFGTKITQKHLKGHLCREERHPAFEYFQDFVDTYKDRPKFTWTWINSVGHDDMNGLMRVDKELVEILEKNKEMFENSFFIFMGDHGFRMAVNGFRYTDIATLEKHNPYLSISIPKRLRQKNYAVLEIMRQNSRKLQTHFDTRATILDLLKYQPQSDFTNRSTLEIPGEKGNSYFRRQPDYPRTCGRLPIPPEYCICQVEKIPITDENLKKRLANKLIDHIHEMLDSANFSSMCERFKFLEVPSLLHFGHTNHSKSTHNYEIIVKVDGPSFAQFQTILIHDKETNEVRFENIVRLDKYGKTGACTNSKLEKFCFCKGLTMGEKWKNRWNNGWMKLNEFLS
uniref:DUF229 domain containing protein n=1 Tax=Caenorhabditis tropicalis TaxID=1561998 RepID=A0A1I7UIY1_9PELO